MENVFFLAASEWIRGFCDLLRKNLTSFSIYFGVQFDFYCFPYEPLHAVGFSGQDSSVTEHDPGSVSCSATVDSSVSLQHTVRCIQSP